MGLWKYLERQKVAMMKRHPSREKTEHTRSMMLNASSVSGVFILSDVRGNDELLR
jgi:hypothetical protein